MQQALNEQAKIDQKLVFDYGLNSRVNVKVVQVLEKKRIWILQHKSEIN